MSDIAAAAFVTVRAVLAIVGRASAYTGLDQLDRARYERSRRLASVADAPSAELPPSSLLAETRIQSAARRSSSAPRSSGHRLRHRMPGSSSRSRESLLRATRPSALAMTETTTRGRSVAAVPGAMTARIERG